MQDEVDQKSIAFVINNGKFTGRMLEKLALHYIRKAYKLEDNVKHKLKHPTPKQGKQSVKKLTKQGQGLTNIEITDKNIKCFEKHAKKHGVDFALKKDNSTDPPKYIVFFKAKDEACIQNAFKDFTQAVKKKEKRASVKQELKDLKLEKKTNKKVSKELVKALKKKPSKGGPAL